MLQALRKCAKQWNNITERKHSKCEKCKLAGSNEKQGILQDLNKWVMNWNKITKRKRSKFWKRARMRTIKKRTSYIVSSNGETCGMKHYYWNETRLLKRNRVSVKNSKNATIRKKFSNSGLRNETKLQVDTHYVLKSARKQAIRKKTCSK